MATKLTMQHFCGKSAVIFNLTGVLIDKGSRIPYIATKSASRQIDPYHIRHYITGDDINQFRHLANLYSIKDYAKFFTKAVNGMADRLHYVDVVPGVSNLIETLRQQNIRIGIVSNYGKELTNIAINKLHKEKMHYDVIINRDNVMVPPPAPWQLYRCMEMFNTYPDYCMYISASNIGNLEGYYAKVDTASISNKNNCKYYCDNLSDLVKEIMDCRRPEF
jgi:beta-phosphoglucomutase-like phosphatase (HAD superfamily)